VTAKHASIFGPSFARRPKSDNEEEPRESGSGYHDDRVAEIIADAVENDNNEDAAPEDQPADYTEGGYVENDKADFSALKHAKFDVEEAY
jgi:hypothetical protein